MIIRLLLLLGGAFLLYWGYRKIRSLPREQRKKTLVWLSISLLIVLTLIAVLTGRMHWLGAVIAALIPIAKFGLNAVLRLMPFITQLRRATAGRQSVFTTQHLEVRLDFSSGRLSGKIIHGPHMPKDLGELSIEEFKELETYYQEHDRHSYYLIKAFQRRPGQSHQSSQSNGDDFGFSSSPSRQEALQILGLNGNPTRKEIISAHRKLIQKLHPDRGGNDYLASRINQAKDVLLN